MAVGRLRCVTADSVAFRLALDAYIRKQKMQVLSVKVDINEDGSAKYDLTLRMGQDVTVSDLEKAQAETQELDSEELDQTAGGWCWADYDCHTAWHHDTPDEEGTDCFKDHDCITLWEHKPIDPDQCPGYHYKYDVD